MDINIWQVLFQAFNFGVILLVLNKFLYKPIQKVLDDREKKINAGLAAAEASLKAQDEVEKSKKSALAGARKSAAEITATATAEAKKQADSIIKSAHKKAEEEAKRIIASGEATLEKKQKEIEAGLKDLVVATTKKLLMESLSSSDIDKINKSILSKLK